MQEEEDYPPTLKAVIDWTEEGSGEWDYEPDIRSISFSFMCEGNDYSGTAIEEEGELLTLTIVYELPLPIDELTLRRRISDVDIVQKYGALIYSHELGVIVWRDSISSDDPASFTAEAVEEALSWGVHSFNALRSAIADLLGVSATDMQLATATAASRA